MQSDGVKKIKFSSGFLLKNVEYFKKLTTIDDRAFGNPWSSNGWRNGYNANTAITTTVFGNPIDRFPSFKRDAANST